MTIIIYTDLKTITNKEVKQEFVPLILFSTLGIFISISARDFILLFCGLELQSLSSYALATFNSNKIKSSEAGLKYFVLGDLVSALMLFGIALLYGFSGSIRFIEINTALNGEFNIGLVIGVILVFATLFFKLSAALLHVWTPDVYEGSPIASVTYFAVAQKMGMLIILINFIDLVIGEFINISVDLIKIISILSIIVGALGTILQVSLKRLMAYSTTLNIGYVLIGVCLLNSFEGKYSAYIYMFIYILGAMGFFSWFIALFRRRSDKATLDDFKGIASNHKTLAVAISIILFSMIGLPPLAGFFAKYYIFYKAIEHGEIILALIGVLTSVTFYYLKIIKYMYFIDTQEILMVIAVIPTYKGLMVTSTITITFTLFFFLFVHHTFYS